MYMLSIHTITKAYRIHNTTWDESMSNNHQKKPCRRWKKGAHELKIKQDLDGCAPGASFLHENAKVPRPALGQVCRIRVAKAEMRIIMRTSDGRKVTLYDGIDQKKTKCQYEWVLLRRMTCKKEKEKNRFAWSHLFTLSHTHTHTHTHTHVHTQHRTSLINITYPSTMWALTPIASTSGDGFVISMFVPVKSILSTN